MELRGLVGGGDGSSNGASGDELALAVPVVASEDLGEVEGQVEAQDAREEVSPNDPDLDANQLGACVVEVVGALDACDEWFVGGAQELAFGVVGNLKGG